MSKRPGDVLTPKLQDPACSGLCLPLSPHPPSSCPCSPLSSPAGLPPVPGSHQVSDSGPPPLQFPLPRKLFLRASAGPLPRPGLCSKAPSPGGHSQLPCQQETSPGSTLMSPHLTPRISQQHLLIPEHIYFASELLTVSAPTRMQAPGTETLCHSRLHSRVQGTCGQCTQNWGVDRPLPAATSIWNEHRGLLHSSWVTLAE